MNSNKNLKYIFCLLIAAMALLMVGDAYAQHEGGLGEKRIHLNIADKEQLMKIEGMTDDLASAIIAYREKSGFFKKPEDLLKVPGITKDVYDKLNPQTGSEGDLYCVPKEGGEDEEDEEDEEPILSPSKC
jgi:competence ComEA-like helix-hairpin-helix protein